MSVNKHYCQGTDCHTKETKDRFQKSTGMLRGRYAYSNMNDGYTLFKIFCSQGCANDWVNEHTQDIINNRPIKFITERRTTPGYEIKTKTYKGWQGQGSTYKIIEKINSQNS